MWQEIRLAARLLLKDRGLTFAAVAVLALGVAATTTVFTVVNAVVLRDMPFTEPDRVVEIGTETSQGNRGGVSWLDFIDVRERTRAFDGIGAFFQTSMNVSDERIAPERVTGAFVSANLFSLLGHQPVLGRPFSPDDDRADAPQVVMLGHAVWQTRYQADRAVIGRTIRVNGIPSVVIGVMAEGFRFPFNADLWQPLRPANPAQARGMGGLTAVGRLKTGVSLEQARDDLTIVMNALAREYPATNSDLQPRIARFRVGTTPQVNLVVFALLGAVVFVLLIACANTANLLLARAVDRTREVSIRLALGASRRQIVRQLLTESLLLASVAGMIGLALATQAVRLFARAITGTGEPYWLDFTMDPRVFVFFAAVCLGTAILFGLAPALHASRVNVGDTLNEAGRGNAGALRARRWAGALVVAQLALAPVLLTGAGLMMRTLVTLYQLDPGITLDGLTRLRLTLGTQAYPSPEQRVQFYRQLDERLASIPNLRAAIAITAPQEGADSRQLAIDGRPDTAGDQRPFVSFMTIGPRYFDTLGVPLLRGRDFTPTDGAAGEAPAIVNARFAALYFPNEDPVGRRLRLTAPRELREGPEWVTVIGVAPNVRQRDPENAALDPIVYVPYASNPLSFTSILVRSESDRSVVVSQLRDEVQAIDPNLPLFDIVTVEELIERELMPVRVFGAMFAIFAVIALIITTVGLYAVTARSVAQRTREIGIRIALGAQAREVWWLVTRRVSIQLGVGVVIGMIGAVAVGRLLQGDLIQVSPTDPLTITAVLTVLVVTAFAASLGPARRAMRLDPVVALRAE